MELHGRFPEHAAEVAQAVLQWIAQQLRASVDGIADFEWDGRHSRRQRRPIRVFLGFRPATGEDLRRLVAWITTDVLPFDPQARHGRDVSVDWFRAQRLEPPALSDLDRAIHSAVHGFEAQLQEAIHMRLSAARKAAIDRLLARDEPDAANDSGDSAAGTSNPSARSQLKADLGKASRDKLLLGIARCSKSGTAITR